MMTPTNEALSAAKDTGDSDLRISLGLGQGSTRGAARAPLENFGARKMPGLSRARLRSCMKLALGVALLLSDEGFQKALRTLG
jgi:hypothetical protein